MHNRQSKTNSISSLLYVESKKEEKNISYIQRTDWYLLEVGDKGYGGGGKISQGGQNVQTSSNIINKSWRYNVQYGDYN